MVDVLGAVYDFITTALSPPPVNVVRGWQNRAALPDSSEFVVLTLISAPRRGTNVHEWTQNDGGPDSIIESVSMLSELVVQVDFCGLDAATVMGYATQLVMLARDAVAVDFFAGYGLSCLYADNPLSLPYSNELDQWVTRYAVQLHLSVWSGIPVQRDYFDSVTVHIEDVDMHHKIITS